MLRYKPRTDLDPIAKKAIRCSVRQAMRQNEQMEANEYADWVQDISLHLLEKEEYYNPRRSRWSTFCSMVARQYISRELQHRARRPYVQSLDETQYDDQGKPFCECDYVEPRHLTERLSGRTMRHRSVHQWFDLHHDLSMLIESLPEELRIVCELFLEHQTIAKVASELRTSEKTIYRRRDRIRKAWAESQVADYR